MHSLCATTDEESQTDSTVGGYIVDILSKINNRQVP